MVLSLTKRCESFETIGQMLRAFKDNMLEQNKMQRIWKLTAALLSSIIAESGADIDTIIEIIINRDSFMRDFNNVCYFQMLEPLSEKS